MLVLEPFQSSDIPQLIGWVPDARFLLQWAGPQYHFPLSVEQMNRALEETSGIRPTALIFRGRCDAEIIGHIELAKIDYLQGTGHICRVLIGKPEFREMGYGTEMIRLLAKLAFEKLQLETLTLNVFTWNAPAIACYSGLGFETWELKTASAKIGSELWDSVKMGLSRKDWAEQRQRPD